MKSKVSVLFLSLIFMGCSSVPKNNQVENEYLKERKSFYSTPRAPASEDQDGSFIDGNFAMRPLKCSQALEMQEEIYNAHHVIASAGTSVSCEDTIKALQKLNQLMKTMKVSQRVRPNSILFLGIGEPKGKIANNVDEGLDTFFADYLGFESDSSSSRTFYRRNQIYFAADNLARVEKALKELPMINSPEGKKYLRERLEYSFAMCGSLSEASYVTSKEIYTTSCAAGKSPLRMSSEEITTGPDTLKKYMHVVADFATKLDLSVNSGDDIYLSTEPYLSSKLKDRQYNAGSLNKYGKSFYNRTLECSKKYLQGKTAWSANDFQASNCFIVGNEARD